MFHITWITFLIVCPFQILAGMVDAIAGGGGLISLPAYMIAGLPAHAAVATNKMSSTCGTAVSTFRFLKNGLINLKLAVPACAATLAGSYLGAHLSMRINERILEYIILAILPVAAFFVLNNKLFNRKGAGKLEITRRTVTVSLIAAFIIGIYDGLYGPGTGTFLIIAFTVFARLTVETANGQAKIINLTSNITALVIFLLNDQVVIILGLAAAACNIAGNYIGSGLVMTNGAKIVRPVIIVVLVLLLIKIISGMS
ncbi:MAG: TSUP family transporter [Lachnospiraceae bacterium]|nr:TSUP family transporter [Lachnospiraceae bacterium]